MPITACDWDLMKIPGTPEQLADAIESLVASYMDEVRLAAQRTVADARGGKPPAIEERRYTAYRSHKRMTRRSRTELDDTCEQLCKLVRARPGESMITLAGEMGMPMSTLQRPMAKLRADGRVNRPRTSRPPWRRVSTAEFKAEALRAVAQRGQRTMAEVASSLGVAESVLLRGSQLADAEMASFLAAEPAGTYVWALDCGELKREMGKPDNRVKA